MVKTELSSSVDNAIQAEAPARSRAGEIETDPLIELELRVARRADELARSAITQTSINLRHWLQAEQEILQPLFERYAAQSQNALGGAGEWLSAAQN